MTRDAESRVFVSAPVRDLLAPYRELTQYQGDKLLEVYKGKWMRVGGVVGELFLNSDGTVQVIAEAGTGHDHQYLSMTFEKAEADSVTHLRKGDRVSAVCKIHSASSSALTLAECETTDGQ